MYYEEIRINITRLVEREDQMRQLKKLDYMRGTLDIDAIIEFGFPLCCVDFYCNVWCTCIRAEIPEYAETMHSLTNNQGLILCPNHILKRLKN